MSRLQRRSISAALRSGGGIPSWILPSAVADRNCVLEHEDAHGIHSPRRFSGFIGFSENGGFCKQRVAFSVSISNSSARSSLGTVRYGLSAVASDSSQVLEKFEYQAQWYPSLRSSRRFSTSILTPQESGVIPPELSKKGVLTTDHHTYGRYEDLVTRVTNFHNEDRGFMVLAGDVFDVPIRKDIVHRVVRWQLAKRQQGTHSTKTISEVSGTGKKPYKQKGLGKARHGTLRGPQFRHGATMHGPKPRSHAIKLQKKVRRLGLKIALSARTAEGKLLIFEDLEVPSHKTKNIVNYVSQMENTKKVLLVDGGLIDEKLKLATQNLHYVNVLPSIGLNVYSILQHDTLVMSRDAVEQIVTRMHTSINR